VLTNDDLLAAIAEVRAVLGNLEDAMTGVMPPLVAARTLLALEEARANLARLAETVQSATASVLTEDEEPAY